MNFTIDGCCRFGERSVKSRIRLHKLGPASRADWFLHLASLSREGKGDTKRLQCNAIFSRFATSVERGDLY